MKIVKGWNRGQLKKITDEFNELEGLVSFFELLNKYDVDETLL